MQKFVQPFVRNRFVESSVQRQLISPQTCQLLATVQEPTPAQVADAIKSAREALETWANSDSNYRRDQLWKLSLGIEANAQELGSLESQNVGKPLSLAVAEVLEVANVFKYYAGYADKICGKTVNVSNRYDCKTIRQPVGVCAIITSYNYPLTLAAWKMAPALACGNTCIVKPHENTPLSTLYLAHLLEKYTDIEPGVLSVLPGGADVGKALAESQHVDKVSFTGSAGVGRLVQHAATNSNLKRVTLELGGKSPLIVFNDVENLDASIDDVVDAIFTNSGQNCCAGSRLFLQKGIYEDFMQLLRKKVASLRTGNIDNPATSLGPLVNKVQFDRVSAIIRDAKDRGVDNFSGSVSDQLQGFFIEPTVFYNVQDSDQLARDEIFGPVLTVLEPFETEAEVLSRANDSEFGLAAGVWTSNVKIADRMSRKLIAGTTWINCYNSVLPCLPFGGLKGSGYGIDLGDEAVTQEYTVARTIISKT